MSKEVCKTSSFVMRIIFNFLELLKMDSVLEKNYECSVCFKRYCTQSSLIRHSTKHSKVRPFRCCFCQPYNEAPTYLYMDNLRVHARRYHEGYIYPCICFKRFRYFKEWKTHLRFEHWYVAFANWTVDPGIGLLTVHLPQGRIVLSTKMAVNDEDNDVPLAVSTAAHPPDGCILPSIKLADNEEDNDVSLAVSTATGESEPVTNSDPFLTGNLGDKDEAVSFADFSLNSDALLVDNDGDKDEAVSFATVKPDFSTNSDVFW